MAAMHGMNANYNSSSTGMPLVGPFRESDATGSSSPSLFSSKEIMDVEDTADDKAEMERRSSAVQALARSYSRSSAAAHDQNPFLAGPDSPLNPASSNFSGREWAKAVVDLISKDGSSFRTAGVCFQNLNVYGFGESSDYQKDVSNVWLSGAGLVRGLMGSSRQRIDILQNFDGLVRAGEMLVVLGPPGSGCSTFLKTIAGEMNGIHVDQGSYFNYQGESQHDARGISWPFQLTSGPR